ncbi:MAG: hypothetical protein ACXADL_01825 [Candidatus Thorarchaeota archaeon]|jgi:hypothetical protein
MTVESTNNNSNLTAEATKEGLLELVVDARLSSVDLMSTQLNTDDDTIVLYLEDLIREGRVNGVLSQDKSRFFRSDLEVSKAPVVPSIGEEPVIKKIDSGMSKYVAIAGMILIVSSAISLNLTLGTLFFENFFRMLFMISIVILAAGCIGISRKNPPSSVRR